MEIKEELLDIEGIKISKKPILELFIRRTAVVTQTSEYLSSLIIKDQWRNMTKESISGNPTAEFDVANMGSFSISKTKALKKIKGYDLRAAKVIELPTDDEKEIKRREGVLLKYEEAKKNIKIKLKINEY